jgi:hypothetical protein
MISEHTPPVCMREHYLAVSLFPLISTENFFPLLRIDEEPINTKPQTPRLFPHNKTWS